MTGSRISGETGVSKHWRLALSSAAGVALLCAFAHAEDQATGAPRGLSPPTDQAQTTPAPQPATAVPAPTPTGDKSTADWQSTDVQTVPTQSGQPHGPAVTVTGLASVDSSGAGLLEPGDGGLRPSLWSGSARGVVEDELAALPNAPNSPAMQTLMRRLLLTSATPPAGNGRSAERSLLALRLNKLIANGWTAEAAALAAQSPRDDGPAHQALAEAMLLEGKQVDACGEPTAMRLQSNDPYWLKMRTFCFLIAGDAPSAQLTLDVMRERQVNDEAFYALAAQMTDKTEAKIASLSNPTGLHVALAHLAGARLPVSIVDSGWVPSYRLFAAAGDKELQLAAAERAAAAGLIQIDQLRAVYDSQSFTADQLDDPEEAAKKLSAARANALFYQAIEKRSIPAARASAFSAAQLRADAQNTFPLFALVAVDAAMEIKPTPDLAWLAPQIERVLLYTGNDAQAERWYAALAGGSPSDAPVVNALQLHVALAEPTPDRTAKALSAMSWLGQNALKPGGLQAWLSDRAGREIPLFEALGYVIPPDAQWALTANTTGTVPTPAQHAALDAMAQASAQGRLGETILEAMIALGQAGPQRAEGRTVARVVKALATVGLNEEARAIAIEAVLGAPSNVHK